MDLQSMAAEVTSVNVANGWFEDDRSWGATCALLTSEIYEMFEAYRQWDLERPFSLKTSHELLNKATPEARHLVAHLDDAFRQAGADVGEVVESITKEQLLLLAGNGFWKPEGFGSELADVLIRWLDTIYREGFSGSEFPIDPAVGMNGMDVSAVIMQGDRLVTNLWFEGNEGVPGKMPPQHKYYLRAILSWIFGVALHYKIDLEWEYDVKIAYNRTRGHKHGGKSI